VRLLEANERGNMFSLSERAQPAPIITFSDLSYTISLPGTHKLHTYLHGSSHDHEDATDGAHASRLHCRVVCVLQILTDLDVIIFHPRELRLRNPPISPLIKAKNRNGRDQELACSSSSLILNISHVSATSTSQPKDTLHGPRPLHALLIKFWRSHLSRPLHALLIVLLAKLPSPLGLSSFLCFVQKGFPPQGRLEKIHKALSETRTR
jgi:hypothetical protein